MSLTLSHEAEGFATTGQLSPEDMAAVKAAGFRSVINNRPDFEGGPTQPTHEAMSAAAKKENVMYAYLPVNGAAQSEAEIDQFRQLLNDLPEPVLAYCRSGTRSYRLYCAAKA